ncbi:uncharacterized protein si:dkey-20d21.12 [Hippocampus zosterae]|uniref:uncharacterized protein si:dkey-20d21.12 n=1 Tax=Hippocampus zosterae TaxID=109293 RepID=UPI00223CA203|nr:uncharacterized protein si:dkey-20d21.12 [Hippocampus zosterae]
MLPSDPPGRDVHIQDWTARNLYMLEKEKLGEMLKTPSQITLQTYRINDKDLTEIELHSVDSINDLHRTYPEHNHKGPRPPRPAFPPSVNGTLHTHHMRYVSGASKWQSRVRDTLIPNTSQAYAMACALITLLLLTLVLIFYFLVQQGGALKRLTEALREKEAAVTQLSALIQQLQALTLNMTATRGRT